MERAVSRIHPSPGTAQREGFIRSRDIWRWGCLFVLINTNEPRLACDSIGFFGCFFQDGEGLLIGVDYWPIGLVEVDGDLISCHGEQS